MTFQTTVIPPKISEAIRKQRDNARCIADEIKIVRQHYPHATLIGDTFTPDGETTHCDFCGSKVLIDMGYVNSYGEFIPTIAECKCGARINGDLNGRWSP